MSIYHLEIVFHENDVYYGTSTLYLGRVDLHVIFLSIQLEAVRQKGMIDLRFKLKAVLQVY